MASFFLPLSVILFFLSIGGKEFEEVMLVLFGKSLPTVFPKTESHLVIALHLSKSNKHSSHKYLCVNIISYRCKTEWRLEKKEKTITTTLGNHLTMLLSRPVRGTISRPLMITAGVVRKNNTTNNMMLIRIAFSHQWRVVTDRLCLKGGGFS